MNTDKGFTLIELMIVIAILGILIAIALPAYQDYSIRTKNAECLMVAAGAKAAVSETHHSATILANIDSNTDAGYSFTSSDYCASINISNGDITAITTSATGGPIVTFVLDSTEAPGIVEWTCTATGQASGAQIPKECR